MRLCYGPSKRLNFVQFMVFAENSTAKLQNTRPIYLHKNNLYCILTRSSKNAAYGKQWGNSTNLDYWKIDTSDSCQLPPHFLYLVDFGTALSTQSSSSSIVFGKRDLPLAMAKTICKLLRIHDAFGIQIQI